jgi:hypothetical protein
MKILTIVLALLLVPLTLHAQSEAGSAVWGVKGGINFSGVRTDYPITDKSSGVGWHGGVYSMLGANEWLFRIEANLTSLGIRLEFPSEIQENKVLYLQVPLILQYQVSELLNFQFGMYSGLRLHAKRSLTDKTDNTTVTTTNTQDVAFFDFGPMGGAGLSLANRLGFELKYHVGIPDSNANSTVNIRTYNQFWQFSVLYELTK